MVSGRADVSGRSPARVQSPTQHHVCGRTRIQPPWQKASGYHWLAPVEVDISRFKRVIGDGLRSRTDHRRET